MTATSGHWKWNQKQTIQFTALGDVVLGKQWTFINSKGFANNQNAIFSSVTKLSQAQLFKEIETSFAFYHINRTRGNNTKSQLNRYKYIWAMWHSYLQLKQWKKMKRGKKITHQPRNLCVSSYTSLGFTILGEIFTHMTVSLTQPLRLSHSIFLTHFILQTRISHFERDIASACKRETLVLDQYFCFCVLSVEVTAPS